MTWGTFHIMYDFSSKLGMHFEYLKCTITLFQKYALRNCVQYQSKMQGSDFLILGFFFIYFFTSTQPSFSTVKGYNTTTNVQADHSASLPELWSHHLTLGKQQNISSFSLITLLAPRIHILVCLRFFSWIRKCIWKKPCFLVSINDMYKLYRHCIIKACGKTLCKR